MLASSPVDSTRRRLAAIAIASFAVLYFQIAATRVLSVLLWYHWAFLSISLAMLGLGVPGVWFALRPPSERALPRFLLAAGLSIPAAIGAVIRIGNQYGSWSVVVCMALLLVPLLLLGCAVCQLLLSARGPAVGRMYGADLVGAAVAAAVVMPSLWWLPTPDAIALLGLLPIGAALLLGAARWSSGLAVALVVGIVLHGGWLQIGATKGYDERALPLIHVKWTPTARLSFFDPKSLVQGEIPGWAWGYGTKAPMVPSRFYFMEQDSSAGTPITEFDGDTSELSEFEYLMFDVTTVGHQVRAPRRVAIVGGGGGRDILCALKAGATDIEVAELNPGVIDAVSGRFGAFSGDVYHCKGVQAHASEGRAFLTRSRGAFDLIQISLIDSWAATAAGAFTLAENNLYTVEAFQLYYARLSDDGMVSTSRWRAGAFPLEAGRLVLLNQQALRGLGVEHPERHLLVVSASNITTVLASKRPFTDAEIATARQVAAQRGFELQYPAPADASVECDPATLLRDGPAALAARGITLAPPTDDRPFFFQVLPVFGRFDPEFARRYGLNAQGVAALQLLLVVLTVLTVALFFLPFLLRRWLPAGPGFWRGSGYFAAIGFSFMFVEVPWLQRFVLFLGHPNTAATVVIGSLLLGAGLGAMRSERFGLDRAARLWPLVPLLLAAGNVAMAPLFEAALGCTEPVRILIAVVLLLPVGYLLGHFFPLGMGRFGDTDKAWFWAVNGACGVLAGVFSLALAMTFGFQAVAWIGVGGYVLAGLLFATGRRA